MKKPQINISTETTTTTTGSFSLPGEYLEFLLKKEFPEIPADAKIQINYSYEDDNSDINISFIKTSKANQ